MNQKMVYCRLEESIKSELNDLSKSKRLSKAEIIHAMLHHKPNADDIPGEKRGRGRKAKKTARVGIKLGGTELMILAKLTSNGATISRQMGNIISNYFLNKRSWPRRKPYTVSAANKRIRELEREIKKLNEKIEEHKKQETYWLNEYIKATAIKKPNMG